MAEGNRRFGEYLKALRHSKHLTLDDVCQLTRGEPDALSRASLSDLENGKTFLTMGRLLLLARVYGVRPAVLVERFETDYDLDQVDRAKLDKLPTKELLDEARKAGMSGHIHRALLMYEQAELRALEGVADADEKVKVRARLGLARALYAAGKYHLARQVLEDLLTEDLDGRSRCWAVFLLCQVAIDLGNRILARGAHEALLEIERPWPQEVDGTEPYLKARLLDLALEETDNTLLRAWLAARDKAKAEAVPTVECHAMIRIAQIERERGELRSAERWARRAFEFAETRGFPWHKACATMEFAQILHVQGNRRDAREAWLKAKTLARRHRLPDLVFKIHAERWRIAVRDGDEKAAHQELVAARKAARYLDGIPGAFLDIGKALAEAPSKSRARRKKWEGPK